MSDAKINIRDNGPLLVEGPFKLVDAAGNELPLPANKPAIALCRCGASANKPFCDGSHKTAGFESAVRCPTV
ncbi:MAG: CDGSH iron-sulfur domain-containing protein [Planctomycetia bacterium]|nr:CDGSH iron-sulfur domain-containing protein [Planctomycetia bacterium]